MLSKKVIACLHVFETFCDHAIFFPILFCCFKGFCFFQKKSYLRIINHFGKENVGTICK